jgi:hypothetical protein
MWWTMYIKTHQLLYTTNPLAHKHDYPIVFEQYKFIDLWETFLLQSMCFAWIYYIVQHNYIWASLHIVFE